MPNVQCQTQACSVAICWNNQDMGSTKEGMSNQMHKRQWAVSNVQYTSHHQMCDTHVSHILNNFSNHVFDVDLRHVELSCLQGKPSETENRVLPLPQSVLGDYHCA